MLERFSVRGRHVNGRVASLKRPGRVPSDFSASDVEAMIGILVGTMSH